MKSKKELTLLAQPALPLTIIALPRPVVPDARTAKSMTRVQQVARAWRAAWRKWLPAPVLGNPLHEAWSADGEPLERLTPGALAKCSLTRYLIVPMNRGQ